MESFYGGKRGQNLIASYKYPNYQAALNDIESSNVLVGQYCLIDYDIGDGLEANCDIDNANNNGYCHAKFLKKVYDAEDGYSYEEILQMSGPIPKVELKESETRNPANVGITMWATKSTEYHKEYEIKFPVPYTFKTPVTTVLPNANPDFVPNYATGEIEVKLPRPYEVEQGDSKLPSEAPELEIDNTNGKLIFKLSKQWEVDDTVTPLLPTDNPEIDTSNGKSIKFKLPTQERIQISLGTPVEATANPTFEFDNGVNYWKTGEEAQETKATGEDVEDYKKFPRLMLHLPKAYQFETPVTHVPDALVTPKVELAATENTSGIKLDFTLPRAAKWHFGDLLGENDPVVPYYITGLAGFEEGDMYVNVATGYVYGSVQKDAGDSNPGVKVYYRGCFQTPKPTVEASGISPYEKQDDSTFAPVEPTITPTMTNTGWNLDFGIPKAPIPQVEVIYVGSEDEGAGDVTPNGTDTIKFTLNVPAGTRIIPGLEVDDDHISAVVAGARKGDIYLNTDSGNYYKLDENGEWVLQGCLIGPIGKALNVIAYLTLDEATTPRADIPAAINTALAAAGKTANPESIVAVSLTNLSSEEESFWYVYVDNVWNPLSLGGGVGSLLRRSTDGYLDSDDTMADDKAYSVKYINSIIGGAKTNTNKDKTAYSKEQVYTTDETYNKTEVYNKTETYTKQEVEDLIAAITTWGTFDDIDS